MYLETYVPHNFLAQQWRASKDSDFAGPTGAAGGTGSFWFHVRPKKDNPWSYYRNIIVFLYCLDALLENL